MKTDELLLELSEIRATVDMAKNELSQAIEQLYMLIRKIDYEDKTKGKQKHE